MEIVNIEARTFEAMLSAFRTFADRLDTLCRLYGDMEEKKWLDNQEVCLLLKVSPRTLQTLRDNGTLAYTQICHKTYYKPEDVESIIRIVEERRKRAEKHGKINLKSHGKRKDDTFSRQSGRRLGKSGRQSRFLHLQGFQRDYRLLAYSLDAEYGRGSFSLYRIDGDGEGCHIRIGTKECRFMSEGCPHILHVMGWGRYMRN